MALEVYELCDRNGIEAGEPTTNPTDAAERARAARLVVRVVRYEPVSTQQLWDFTGEEEECETTWPDGALTEIPPAC